MTIARICYVLQCRKIGIKTSQDFSKLEDEKGGGRHTCTGMEELQCIDRYISLLSKNSRGLRDSLNACLWFIFPLESWFFALFMFDILGDEVGSSQALWVPIFFLLFPFAVLGYVHLYRYFASKLKLTAYKEEDMKEGEEEENGVGISSLHVLESPWKDDNNDFYLNTGNISKD